LSSQELYWICSQRCYSPGKSLSGIPKNDCRWTVQSAEGSKHIQLSITGNLVLDTSGESSIEAILESGFSPLGACGESVELHEILRDLLTIVHPEILELGLGCTFRVVRSEGDLQLGYKLLIVREPAWLINQISFEESGFEPI
jgi:hypothetical protein